MDDPLDQEAQEVTQRLLKAYSNPAEMEKLCRELEEAYRDRKPWTDAGGRRVPYQPKQEVSQ